MSTGPKLEAADLDLEIEIDDMVYRKVMHWVDKSQHEVSGLGKVIYDKESNIIRVVDAILLPQENSYASTEIKAEDVCKAMFHLKDAPGDLRWWWHSHVNFDVYWSGTDMATIKQLAAGGWFLSSVFNQKREYKTCFAQAAPVRLMVDDLPIRIMRTVEDSLVGSWDKEYEEKVKTKQLGFGPGMYKPGNVADFWTEDEEAWKRFLQTRKFVQESVVGGSRHSVLTDDDVEEVVGADEEIDVDDETWVMKDDDGNYINMLGEVVHPDGVGVDEQGYYFYDPDFVPPDDEEVEASALDISPESFGTRTNNKKSKKGKKK